MQYNSIPHSVEAFQHKLKQPIPEPFASLQRSTAQGEIGIGKDAVGQLLVPVAGSFQTARIDDYIILTEDGELQVMSPKKFLALYREAEAEPETKKVSKSVKADEPTESTESVEG